MLSPGLLWREHCKSTAGRRHLDPGAGRFPQLRMLPPHSSLPPSWTGQPGLGISWGWALLCQPQGCIWGRGQFWEQGMQEKYSATATYCNRIEIWLFKAFFFCKLWLRPACSQFLDSMTVYMYCHMSRSNQTTT